jgi:hypothetical protein
LFCRSFAFFAPWRAKHSVFSRKDRQEQQRGCFAFPLRPLRLGEKNILFSLAKIAKNAKNNNEIVLLFLCVLCALARLKRCFAVPF